DHAGLGTLSDDPDAPRAVHVELADLGQRLLAGLTLRPKLAEPLRGHGLCRARGEETRGAEEEDCAPPGHRFLPECGKARRPTAVPRPSPGRGCARSRG